MQLSERFDDAITLMDEANGLDPNRDQISGMDFPKELLYARRMTEWLLRLDPEASEALQLAARCQHIERWRIPREDYPMDRKGYLKWRSDLKKFHAERAGEILQEAGYDSDMIERVQYLVMKKGLKKDPESQLLEDVICLVFLDYYFAEFIEKHTDEKIISILQKTWRKMSERGHEAAKQLSFPKRAAKLVEQALAG